MRLSGEHAEDLEEPKKCRVSDRRLQYSVLAVSGAMAVVELHIFVGIEYLETCRGWKEVQRPMIGRRSGSELLWSGDGGSKIKRCANKIADAMNDVG